jgi:carbon storage regulator CsrA
MLVLSRMKNEGVVIGNDIVLTVVEIRGDKVRLGIVAPKDVPVHRQEVHDALHGIELPGPPPRPPEEVAFLQAVGESPDDDGIRLIFADWLDDHGQPERAEFIRVQVALASLPPGDSRRDALQVKEQALLEEHRDRWLEPLRPILQRPPSFGGPPSFGERLRTFLWRPRSAPLPWHVECCARFHRGFVESLFLPAAAFLAHAEALFRAAPGLVDFSADVSPPAGAASLLGSPHLARLRGLSIHDDLLGREAVQRLVACPHLGNLKRLCLASPSLDASCVAILAEAPLLERLAGLAFVTRRFLGQSEWDRGTLEDDAAQILAGSLRCRNLESLDLSFNRIGDAGAAALASSPHLARLRDLSLLGNPITDEGRQHLRERFGDCVHL